MSEEEIINKSNDYIRLFENGYCENCNELCLIDNFPNKDLKNLLYAWQSIYKKEKEKNKELENKITKIKNIIDTNPYTAYTLYGDILYDDQAIRDIIENTEKFRGELW